MVTPILETNRLTLRPFKEDDAARAFECWECDPDVARYMFWTSHDDIEKTKEWIAFELGQIEKDDWYRFAMVENSTGQLIGTVILYFEEEVSSWEIGYNLGKAYWGKGYTTEAVEAVIAFAKARLGIGQIVGRYAKENPASGNVMKKLGFIYEKDIPYVCNDGAVEREGVQCRLTLTDRVFQRLGIEDKEIIKQLFTSVFTGAPWHDDWSDAEQLDQYLVDLVGQSNSLTYGLFEDGVLVAMAMGRIRHWFSGTEYNIDELCVRTDKQGTGIGTQFLNEVEKALKQIGVVSIFLQTENSVPAYGFYQNRGFTELTGHVSFGKKI